ncbi:tellurite resistance TerB family protein [Chelatococcus reniformis]|uniref:DUF533 domain-containing protein n=1 Tax=Chelatococcus reniformis TaxID=1494448 RepID=A0A916U8N6_9HYPH|nr:DUF533 domain-containing protein [Chelatococcus reniformis]GGC63559.1 hypothetical protein GCM10010994_22710 [Chelatococcus reniformis]
MFDAKQILDAMVGAGALGSQSQSAQQQTPAAQGGLADMLNQALGGLTNGQAAQPGQQPGLGGLLGQILAGGQGGAAGAGPGAGGPPGGGLGDLLGQVLGGQGTPGAQGAPGGAGGAAGGGGLGGLLGQILGGGQGGASGSGLGGALAGGAAAGGLGGLLGQLLGGAQGGAADPQAANSGATIGDSLSKVAGPKAGGILQNAISFAQTPQGAAILAGLAGLMVTKATSTVSSNAAQLGGAALIGGLTYKAMKNWQGGAQPQATAAVAPAIAPPGSGFESKDLSHEDATVLINAMIAAAAADGSVDPGERAKIAGTLQGAGFNPEAATYLDQAFSNPPSVQDLADAASSPEQAAQIYEAARITIDPDSPANAAFLGNLKQALGLDDTLVAHLDAAAQSARA